MSKLKEYNGHYCESEYEYAFIQLLEAEDWNYISGKQINRENKRDVLIADDFKIHFCLFPELTEDEVVKIFDYIRLVGSRVIFPLYIKFMVGWLTVFSLLCKTE